MTALRGEKTPTYLAGHAEPPIVILSMVFRAGLLDPENITSIRETCADNRPFPHIIIQDAIQDEFLRRVRDEINSNL
jgi:hypothetical protein